MAVQSNDIGFASVGVSCQATHQMENQLALIGELAGGALRRFRTPFDWIVCPARGAARMIQAWRFHPDDVSELSLDDEAPYWSWAECWFWHDAAHLQAGDFVARQAHFTTNFARLRQMRRQVFILSNTQTNLDRIKQSVRRPLDYDFNDEDVEAVESALQAQFPNAELWVMALKGRHVLKRRKDHPRTIEFAPHSGKWKGDFEQWEAAFRRMLAPED